MRPARPNPNELVRRFTREVDQILAQIAAPRLAPEERNWEVDVREENGVLWLAVPAPGAGLADVSVRIENGVLTVALRSAKRLEERATPLPR